MLDFIVNNPTYLHPVVQDTSLVIISAVKATSLPSGLMSYCSAPPNYQKYQARVQNIITGGIGEAAFIPYMRSRGWPLIVTDVAEIVTACAKMCECLPGVSKDAQWRTYRESKRKPVFGPN